MTTHSLYSMISRPRRKRGGEGRRRGRGILDGPLYTQHALFGKRPAHMPAYGVGRRKRRTTYGMGARRTIRRPVYVSRMGMGRRRKRGGSILGSIHDFAKKHRLVSRGLHHASKYVSHPLGNKALTFARNFAATQGYGRRRRRRRVMGCGPGIMTGMGRRRRKRRTKPSMAQIASVGMGRRHYKRGGDGRRRRRGGSIFSAINDFLKKHKVLSTIGKAVTPLAGSFAPLVSGATQYAESQGYGRKHHMSAHHIHPRHHMTHHGVGLRHHSAHHMRRGGNNPYPTTNSFYGKPVF